MAGRITHLLWHDGCAGEELPAYFGAYYLNAPPNERSRFRSIPEIYVGEFVLPPGGPIGTSGQVVNEVANGTPFFVDTGTLAETSLTQVLERMFMGKRTAVLANGVYRYPCRYRVSRQRLFMGRLYSDRLLHYRRAPSV